MFNESGNTLRIQWNMGIIDKIVNNIIINNRNVKTCPIFHTFSLKGETL